MTVRVNAGATQDSSGYEGSPKSTHIPKTFPSAQRVDPNPVAPRCLNSGAGDGNRTHEIEVRMSLDLAHSRPLLVNVPAGTGEGSPLACFVDRPESLFDRW